ncbi:MAG: hypothetical protein J1E34_02235 [Oscillospiraceae bacterium]|nr:hypothetical protein [Oscillospiraceae bacterium]
MKKAVKIIVFIIINIIPISVFGFFKNQKTACAIILVYSMALVCFNIAAHIIEKLHSYQYFSLPVGLVILFIASGYKRTLCGNLYFLPIILIITSIIILSTYFLSKKTLTLSKCALLFVCIFIILTEQTLYLNESFDTSEVVPIRASVVEKYANGNWCGGFSFSSFDVQTDTMGVVRVFAPGEINKNTDIGDFVELSVRNGFLGIKYCYLDK